MIYHARFEPAAEGGWVVSFRDIPEALTQGDSHDECLSMGLDVLLLAMNSYFESRLPIPAPSPPEAGEVAVALPPSVVAKILLLNTLVQQNISQVALARRLHTRPQEVQRLVDLSHSTKIDTLAAALQALGQRLELRLL